MCLIFMYVVEAERQENLVVMLRRKIPRWLVRAGKQPQQHDVKEAIEIFQRFS
jgi:hypothetical protein